MESLQTIEPLLDAKALKKLLKCSLPLVYKMAERGQIPCVRIPCPGEGRKKERNIIRFKREDVFNFIEDHYSAT